MAGAVVRPSVNTLIVRRPCRAVDWPVTGAESCTRPEEVQWTQSY